MAIDEIAIRKGHLYLTVVLDYERGRVLWTGKHRRAKTLSRFFNQMPRRDSMPRAFAGPQVRGYSGAL